MASTELTRERVPVKSGVHVHEQQARMARTAYLYILPAAIVMTLITFWPLIYQFWMSLTNYSNRNLRTDNLLLQMFGSLTGDTAAYNSPTFIGLANYAGILFGGLAEVLSGFDFWRILTFNLVWTFVNLVFHVAIGVGIAVLLNQEGFKFKRFYRALFIIPWAMPALVSAMIWRNMFDDQSGAINQLLRSLGLPGTTRWLQQVEPPFPWIPPIIRVPVWTNAYFFLFLILVLFVAPYFLPWVRQRWVKFTIVWAIVLELFFFFLLTPLLNLLQGIFGSTPTADATQVLGLGSLFPLSFFAVMIANVWLGWPFMMVVATGALQSIPKDMYEAAEMDGANSWDSFWNVTVPLIRPAMIPAIIIGMTLTFNQFSVFYFISGGGPLHSTEILVTQAYRLVNEVTINLPGVGNVRPYGYAAAFAYIVFAVLATITLITNRVSRATQSAAD